MDLIERQNAIDAICTWDKFGVDERGRLVRWYEGLEPYVHLRDVVFAIEKLPSAEKTGKWLSWKAYYGKDRKSWSDELKCSECGFKWGDEDYKFCPMCGAKMEGVEDDN